MLVHEEGSTVIELKTPLKKEDVLKLKAGDKVVISGTVISARDKAHAFMLSEDFPKAKDAVIYHCGPVIKDGSVISAGPTTSARMSQYTPELIGRYGVKAIIGKGGMDDSVLCALKGRAVYLSATGGAAVTYAQAMKVKSVSKEEFGMPEAMWEFEIRNFPAIVTMDAHGKSLHKKVLEDSGKSFRGMI